MPYEKQVEVVDRAVSSRKTSGTVSVLSANQCVFGARGASTTSVYSVYTRQPTGLYIRVSHLSARTGVNDLLGVFLDCSRHNHSNPLVLC